MSNVVANLPLLARRRGFAVLLGTAIQHIGNGGGVRRFFSWCREAIAYERRHEVHTYQKWLGRRFLFDDDRENCRHKTLCDRDREGARSPRIVEVQPRIGDTGSFKGEFPVSELIRRAGELASDGGFIYLAHPFAHVTDDALLLLCESAVSEGADVVFCDEDILTDSGPAYPRFKPAFSVDLNCYEDNVGPVLVVRASALSMLDASLAGGSITAYEIVLRMYESGRRIVRLPRVLVHWRSPRPLELSQDEEEIRNGYWMRRYGCAHAKALMSPSGHQDFLRSADCPLVSIIIPTRDRLDLLKKCISSIFSFRCGVPFEIVILNNRSQGARTLEYLAEAARDYENLSVVDADYTFNWSKLNNDGIAHSRGDVLLFLNNDVEITSPGWLDHLMVHAVRPDIGVVGPLLLFPDGTVQHAGVVIGIGGFADHVYSGVPLKPDDYHAFVNPSTPRNVLACTGACLMVERRKLEALNGFDERLRICGDVEFCLRLHKAGYMNLYQPNVRLYHYESATRSKAPLPKEEIDATTPACQEYLNEGDPYFNPNLSLTMRYPSYRC